MSAGRERDKVLLGGGSLSPEQFQWLAQALYEAGMRGPGERQEVLDWVVKRHSSFSPRRDDRDQHEIVNFIQAALDDDESFDYLLDALEVRASDDPAFERLLDLTERLLRRSSLTKDELRDLLALQPDEVADGRLLAKGVRLAWPDMRDLTGVGGVRDAALVLLDAQDVEAGVARLLRFVLWLANLAEVVDGVDKAGELRAWTESVAAAHGVPDSARRVPVAAATAGAGPILLIELDSETTDVGRFAVHLWLWTPESGIGPVDWDGQEVWYRPDELEEQLDKLLESALGMLGDDEGKLRVEFWLDYNLVQQDVDQWMLGTGDDGPGPARPLGAEYAVVVRPRRKRPLKPSEKRAWRARWRALQTATGPGGDLYVWIRDESKYSPEALWAMLNEKLAKVLVVPLGPSGQLDGRLHQLLCQGLRYGVPIALCVRRAPADAVRILGDLEAELAETPLADLPDRVHRWRRKAFAEDPNHFGRHLVLLWDDYDRRLPDAQDDQLALPTVKGTD